MAHLNEIEVLQATVDRHNVTSESMNDKLKNMDTDLQQISSQLSEIERAVPASFERRLDKTEWLIHNNGQDIMAKLTVAQADAHTSASRGLVTIETVKEILEKVNMQSVLMTKLVSLVIMQNCGPRH